MPSAVASSPSSSGPLPSSSTPSSSCPPPPPPPPQPAIRPRSIPHRRLSFFQRAENESRGRHLIATQSIRKHQLIFCERPLVAWQSLGNASQGALVCRYCKSFVDAPDIALALASGNLQRHEIESMPSLSVPNDNDLDNDGDIKLAGAQAHSNNTKVSISTATTATTAATTSSNPNIILCRQGCGEVFCSVDCETDFFHYGGHALLCTGLIPDDDTTQQHPLIQFKQHAMESNEIFFMAADLLACLQQQPNLQDKMFDFTQVPWWTVATLPLLQHLGGFAQAAQLESVLQLYCQDSARLLQQVLSPTTTTTSSSPSPPLIIPTITPLLLAKIIGSFEQNAIGIRRRHALCRTILDEDSMMLQTRERRTNLMACLRRAGLVDDDGDDDNDRDDDDDDEQQQKGSEDDDGNNDQKEVTEEDDNTTNGEDALAAILARLYIDEDGTVRDIAAVTNDESNEEGDENDNDQNNNNDNEEDDQDDDDQDDNDDDGEDDGMGCIDHINVTDEKLDDLDAMFPPLDGLAMYSMACKMNHSCDPNVVVMYWTRGWGKQHPLTAYCIALKDIVPGEELCISYISANLLSYQQRQEALANYGFKCFCSKCVSEQAGTHDDDNDNENQNSTSKQRLEEDDLFGEDDEDEDAGDEDGEKVDDAKVAAKDVNTNETNGRAALQQRLEELDTVLNHSKFGSIPIEILAGASSWVVQTAATTRPRLMEMRLDHPNVEDEDNHESSQLPEQLERCKIALQQRDFVMCKLAGGNLEGRLFYHLQASRRWPSPAYREAYWCATVTAAIGHAHECSFMIAQQFLDKGLILGLPRQGPAEQFLDYVEHHAYDMAHGPIRPAVNTVIECYQQAESDDWHRCLSRPLEYQMEEIHLSDLEAFKHSDWFSGMNGVVLRSAAAGWPAVALWRDLGWWVEHYGYRVVPIEVGSMSTGMSEKILTLREFVETYIEPSVERGLWSLEDSCLAAQTQNVAYLAQHAMLDQMPSLCEGVNVKAPNLCGEGGPTQVNVWMGTGGTRTPLHFDTYDNWLVQLVGVKYVRIYPRDETKNLYVSKDASYALQGNMSDLECELEDYNDHPLAQTARYQEVVLFPGDSLFLPAGCWHYVRSLSTSISINFWF